MNCSSPETRSNPNGMKQHHASGTSGKWRRKVPFPGGARTKTSGPNLWMIANQVAYPVLIVLKAYLFQQNVIYVEHALAGSMEGSGRIHFLPRVNFLVSGSATMYTAPTAEHAVPEISSRHPTRQPPGSPNVQRRPVMPSPVASSSRASQEQLNVQLPVTGTKAKSVSSDRSNSLRSGLACLRAAVAFAERASCCQAGSTKQTFNAGQVTARNHNGMPKNVAWTRPPRTP